MCPDQREPAKAGVRRALLATRAALSPAVRERAGQSVAERVLALPDVAGVAVVAAYDALGAELPTTPLLIGLAARGVEVLLPSWAPGAPLTWTGGRDLAVAGAVVVPGVAFTPDGWQVGRGGGHYDRALAALAPEVPRIGLSYDETLVDDLPHEEHDVPMTVVVTPTRVLRAGQPSK